MTYQILAVPPRRPYRWSDAMGCFEIRCGGCNSWWPADAEFWHPVNPHTRIKHPRSRCRACESEANARYRTQRKAA